MAESETSLLSPEATGDNSQQETQWYPQEYAENVAKKGWKAPNDVVKSYFELEKTMGSRVKMPTPESSAEEIRAFYQKTGCPENPDGYEIPEVEGAEPFRNENVEKALRHIAHTDGVSKQAFGNMVKGFYEQLVAGTKASREQGEKALREEFGAKYDEQLTIARRFADQCSDGFIRLLDSSGLGNNPIFVKEFINLGKKIMEDTIVKGDGGGKEKEGEYKPMYSTSPEMYATGEDDESKKARAWFEKRGHKY